MKRVANQTEVILTRDHLEDIVDEFMEFDAFAFDCETRGEYRLDPRRNEVFWISMAGPGGRSVAIPFGHPIGKQVGIEKRPQRLSNGKMIQKKFPVYDAPPQQMWPADVFEVLKPLFIGNDAEKAGHNIKFDLESMGKYWKQIPDGPYFDTQIAAFVLNENHRMYRLIACVEREFGISYDKDVGRAVETYPFTSAADYAHYDAKYTWLLRQKYRPMIDEQRLTGIFNLEMDIIPVLCRMEERGAPVDREALEKVDAELDVRLEQLRADLYKIVGRVWNFGSTPQRVEVFYGPKKEGGQGLRCKKMTPKGNPSCDSDALEYHRGNPLVDTYLEYQEVAKLSSTYVKAYLGTAEVKNRARDRNNAPPFNEETGCIHANFKQTGAVTGRFSCSEPNLQNIPRPDTEYGKLIRGFFIAPEGGSLIVADWSQIEYRILAKYSEDKRLIKAFQEGLDFHHYVATLLLKKDWDDVTKVERTTCKNCNFATVYGAGPDKVAAMSGITVPEAKEFLALHKKMLPSVYRFNDRVIRTCKSRRPPYVKTMLGRYRRLPAILARDWSVSGYAERQAVNTVIQGSAADLVKYAMVRYDAIAPPEMPMILTVHDEMVAIVPEGREDEGYAVMEEAMMGADIAELLDPVPLVADIKVVKRWAEAK